MISYRPEDITEENKEELWYLFDYYTMSCLPKEITGHGKTLEEAYQDVGRKLSNTITFTEITDYNNKDESE
jgi:hypothetical protein